MSRLKYNTDRFEIIFLRNSEYRDKIACSQNYATSTVSFFDRDTEELIFYEEDVARFMDNNLTLPYAIVVTCNRNICFLSSQISSFPAAFREVDAIGQQPQLQTIETSHRNEFISADLFPRVDGSPIINHLDGGWFCFRSDSRSQVFGHALFGVKFTIWILIECTAIVNWQFAFHERNLISWKIIAQIYLLHIYML